LLPTRRIVLFWVAILCFIIARSSDAQVVINEVGSSNDSSVENNAKFPDWIEFYNTSSVSAVNLGGMSVTNLENKDPRFFFPNNTLLGPNAYLILWCDTDTAAPGFHAGFSLKATGASIALYATDGTVLDQVAFGLQVTDLTVARIPNGTGGFQLCSPTPALPNQPVDLGDQFALRFNEWMATNSAGADKDWLEVYNLDPLPVILGGLVPTGKATAIGERTIPALSFIAGNGFIRFWCDSKPGSGADHLNFKLSSSNGEILTLFSAAPNFFLIDQVSFPGNSIPGQGLQRDESMGRLPDGGTNIVKFPPGRDSPGASNFLPITNVVINEFLTHTDPPLEDAIELYNPTTAAVDISYWWLSNNRDKPNKFHIPANTIMEPQGFKVFYEQRIATGGSGGFNGSGTGIDPDFTLNSAHGGELYLFTGDPSGNVTGYRRGVTFGPAAHGVSFGRYVNSVGDVDITAMPYTTFGHDNPSSVVDFRLGTGLPNPLPLVGPIVINEIMYHPPDIGTNDNSIDEYIELRNITSTNVPLYWVDATNRPGVGAIVFTNGWKLDDAVTFSFPGTDAIAIPPNDYLLVVNFNPVTNLTQLAAFRSKFGIPQSFTRIYGPYGGKLKNSSATIRLFKPDTVQDTSHPDAGFVPFVQVEKVSYGDSAPWPSSPDAGGASLQRRLGSEYGNDPINWGAMGPTPGRANTFTNALKVDSISRVGGRVDIVFTVVSGQPYTLEFKNALNPAVAWTTLSNLTMTASGPVHITDTLFSPTGSRFYQLHTSGSP